MTWAQNETVSPNDVPRELLNKYVTNAPRYTSYPTAPHFKSGFDRKPIESEWRASNAKARKGLSLYIHIPFCKTRCRYCGCFTEVGRPQDFAGKYVEALLREADFILSLISRERPVEQLALGGGTPVFLARENMKKLVQGIKERFSFSDDCERSIEVDPRRVDEGYLDTLIALGFNRFSFGVQDLDSRVQKAIGRICAEEKISWLVNHLKGRGIQAVNLDLIHGLPEQTPESFEVTIKKVLGMAPSRIALFGYAHVPWVSPHQKKLEEYRMPGPEEKLGLFGLAFDRFISSGYSYVGMDHFALPDDELIQALNTRTLTRNFMGYTTRRGLELISQGASSISSVGKTYTQNMKDIESYTEDRTFPKWFKALLMSEEDELRRDIIIDMFCNFYLDVGAVERKHKIDFKSHFATELDTLAEYEREGLLRLNDASISVTGLGRLFIRNICTAFDAYMRGDDSKRYSKTF